MGIAAFIEQEAKTLRVDAVFSIFRLQRLRDIMKVQVAYLLPLVVISTVIAEPMVKRFLTTSAEDTFNSYASGVDFDSTVQLLIPYIHSDMSIAACVVVCQGAAASLLG